MEKRVASLVLVVLGCGGFPGVAATELPSWGELSPGQRQSAQATLDRVQLQVPEADRAAAFREGLRSSDPKWDLALGHSAVLADPVLLTVVGPGDADRLWRLRGQRNDAELFAVLRACCEGSIDGLMQEDANALASALRRPTVPPVFGDRQLQAIGAAVERLSLAGGAPPDLAPVWVALEEGLRLESAALPELVGDPPAPPHGNEGRCLVAAELARWVTHGTRDLAAAAGRWCADPRRGPNGLLGGTALCVASGTSGCLQIQTLAREWPRNVHDLSNPEREGAFRSKNAHFLASRAWTAANLWPDPGAVVPWPPDLCAVELVYGSHCCGPDASSLPTVEAFVQGRPGWSLGPTQSFGREGDFRVCLRAPDEASATEAYEQVVPLIGKPARGEVRVVAWDGRVAVVVGPE